MDTQTVNVTDATKEADVSDTSSKRHRRFDPVKMLEQSAKLLMAFIKSPNKSQQELLNTTAELRNVLALREEMLYNSQLSDPAVYGDRLL